MVLGGLGVGDTFLSGSFRLPAAMVPVLVWVMLFVWRSSFLFPAWVGGEVEGDTGGEEER